VPPFLIVTPSSRCKDCLHLYNTRIYLILFFIFPNFFYAG
jgi:hypothetical protein